MICLCIFISLAPELVIYDNACRLHEYCLNRDPAFFKKTKFVVDKFHWKNHSGKLPYSSYFTWSELIDPKMAVFMFSQNLLIYNCPLCVGCCEGYNMKLYPTLNMYNSQAAEQCNSCIKPPWFLTWNTITFFFLQNFIFGTGICYALLNTILREK